MDEVQTEEEKDYYKRLNILRHWGVNLLHINCVPLYKITGKCKPKWLESKGRNFIVSSTNTGISKYILRQVTVQQQPYTFCFSNSVFWQEYIQWCFQKFRHQRRLTGKRWHDSSSNPTKIHTYHKDCRLQSTVVTKAQWLNSTAYKPLTHR
jgi:hypothetical protein